MTLWFEAVLERKCSRPSGVASTSDEAGCTFTSAESVVVIEPDLLVYAFLGDHHLIEEKQDFLVCDRSVVEDA